MNRKTSSVAVALILMLAAAPAAANADDASGGAPVTSTQPTTSSPSDATTAPGTTTTTPASPAAPTTVSPTKAVKLTRSQTKSVQRRVKVHPDGAVGARTRVAIRKYQAQRKLTKTGRPNLETIKAMKLPFATTVEQKLAATTRAAPDASGNVAPATGDVATAIAAARSAIGTPYASGGTTTAGFDCSGLTLWAFKQAGVTLPRTSFDQFKVGTAVEQSAIQAGDLVFFDTAGPGASHVGIATSPTTVISATTHGVMEHQLDDDYWGAAYVGARRVAVAG